MAKRSAFDKVSFLKAWRSSATAGETIDMLASRQGITESVCRGRMQTIGKVLEEQGLEVPELADRPRSASEARKPRATTTALLQFLAGE